MKMNKIALFSFGLMMLVPGVRDARADEERYVKDIKITGLQRVEPETVLSYVDIRKASHISQDKLDGGLKRLYATGLFSDVRLDVDHNGVLYINVQENPIIGERAFEGNDKIDDSILAAEVQMKPRSLYSRYKVQEDVQRILEVYKRSGRYAASVEPKIVKRGSNRIDLIYEISEGPLAKVDKINFSGNKHYSGPDLSNEIMTKESRWYRIFSASENYDPEKMAYDKELLRRFYLRRGYADFRVVSAVAELSPDKKSFTLSFVVDEGARYEISGISVASRLKGVDTQSLEKDVTFSKGDWYNAEEIDKSANAITDGLGRQGFAFVDVAPELRRDAANGKIAVAFSVGEGQRIFVDRINIAGNSRTEDEVIRREMRIGEGDAFNAGKIKASRRNVEALDYFSKIDIDTVPGNAPDKADVNVKVEEKSTGYFNIGVGYSTVNGALVRAGVTENNFRGKGERLSLDASVSQRYKEYMASFTEPWFLGYPLSAGADLFSTERNYHSEASYDDTSTGGRLRLGWKYTDALSQYARYVISQDEVTNVSRHASPYIKAEEGSYINSAVGQTLAYDKRDSAVNPREGYFLSFGNDVGGVGGDEKYLKFDSKAYGYYTVADDYTFKTFVNGGYITAYGDQDDVRLPNRYYLGGNTMRGFQVAGIGARDKRTGDALGGDWMIYSGAELSFPIGLTEMGVKGHTFVDVGMMGKPSNIDDRFVDYSAKPRVSAGVGFQWQSPMGQIEVDFGFPIVKETYDKDQVFLLNFGTRL